MSDMPKAPPEPPAGHDDQIPDRLRDAARLIDSLIQTGELTVTDPLASKDKP